MVVEPEARSQSSRMLEIRIANLIPSGIFCGRRNVWRGTLPPPDLSDSDLGVDVSLLLDPEE